MSGHGDQPGWNETAGSAGCFATRENRPRE